MYFTELPDHSRPGFNEDLHFSNFKKHNVIFNAHSSSSNCEYHIGCLSFKTVLNGKEWYGFGHQDIAVNPGQFLLLNNEQEYSSRIQGGESTKTISIFFKKEFALAVFHDALYSDYTLLDDPMNIGEKMPEFFQTLQPISSSLQSKLAHLISLLDKEGYNGQMVDECLIYVLHHLIGIQQSNLQQVTKIDALKPATRMEIYKRLCIARDFLHSTYINNPNLDDISKEACLSVPQLVRHFKAVFGVTTHRYLKQIRLQHATQLLKSTRNPVHEITWMCGFENVSAFSRAFKTEYGEQPTEYRKHFI
jgi:AraC family transcriptional regulator